MYERTKAIENDYNIMLYVSFMSADIIEIEEQYETLR